MSSAALTDLRLFLEPLYHLKEHVFNLLLSDPLLGPQKEKDFVNMDEERRLVALQLRRATELGLSFANPLFSDPSSKSVVKTVFSCLRETRPMWTLALGLHMMFASVVESLGTAKHAQFFKSSPKVQTLEIFGCFALTELAHGTNVQGLLTTVTYQPATQDLLLNTPRNERGIPIGAKWFAGCSFFFFFFFFFHARK